MYIADRDLSGVVNACLARDVNPLWFQGKVYRCGVIPYIVLKGKVYFCMGRDSKSQDITDFGGGLSMKRDKTPIRAAVRELKEESLNIFKRTSKDVMSCLCVYNNSSLIVFVNVGYSSYNMSVKKFKLSYKNLNESECEMDNIIWLDVDQLNTYIQENKIYTLTSDLIKNKLEHISSILVGRKII